MYSVVRGASFSWRCFGLKPSPSPICGCIFHAFYDQSNQMHHMSGAFPLPSVPARVTRGHSWLLICIRLRLLAVSLLSTARPLCPSQCLCGTIMMTKCLMVWDFRVAEPMPSRWPNLFLIYHDFLPTQRRGSHVKSDKTHTQSPRYTS